MKMDWKKGLLFVSVVLFVISVSSCNLFIEQEVPDIKGSWVNGDSKIVITDDTYSSYYMDSLSYEYSIESVRNDEWAEGEEGSGNYGYIVIKYTTAPSWNPDVTGKYNVLRWQNLETTGGVTTISYSEGYNVAGYFDYVEAAREGATAASGYFSLYSSMTKQ